MDIEVAKIQGVIHWPILKIVCPMMIFESPLCFEDAIYVKLLNQQ